MGIENGKLKIGPHKERKLFMGLKWKIKVPPLLTPHPSLLTPHSSLLTPHSSLLTPHSTLNTQLSTLHTPLALFAGDE